MTKHSSNSSALYLARFSYNRINVRCELVTEEGSHGRSQTFIAPS